MADADRPGSAGLVAARLFHFAQPGHELELDSGERLGPVTLAYETYGTLNADKSNAILVHHALSGDAHAAGIALDDSGPSALESGLDGAGAVPDGPVDHHRLGWWDTMIGPGKAFDTDRYFVISSNVIGGCRGSTGPSSVNLETGVPYGLSFPVVTISDMVRAQAQLLDFLGIERLLCVSGGSMGGMQSLEWAVNHRDRVVSCIPIATCARLSAQGIAFNEVGRRAIISDQNWRNGEYYGNTTPDAGLAIARMIGHITYLSDESMRRKFGRRLRGKEKYGYDFSLDFEVESYLHYKGNRFVERFDANSYLYITKAMDYFDLSDLTSIKSKMLVISFSSDWLFPPARLKALVRTLRRKRKDVTYCDVQSSRGHDAFLLEVGPLTELLSGFLDNVYRR